jgi:hypothetical protein
VLSRFVIRCVECRGGCVWVSLVGFLQGRAWWFLSVGSGILFVGCNCMNVEVMDRCMHLK